MFSVHIFLFRLRLMQHCFLFGDAGINSHDHSLATLEIIDEVRKQSGIIYPADK